MVWTDRELKTCVNLAGHKIYSFHIYNHANELQWKFTDGNFKKGKAHAFKIMRKLQRKGGAKNEL